MLTIIYSIIWSSLGSALFVFVTLLLYRRMAKKYSNGKAYAECWWLPAWNCFRFVIRNIGSNDTLYSIKYRAYIRNTTDMKSGSSVESYSDHDLNLGERIILRGGEDLPVLCFRIKKKGNKFIFIHTNKFGLKINKYPIAIFNDTIVVEYQLKILRFGFIHFEVTREFTIPSQYQYGGCLIVPIGYFLSEQNQNEHEVGLIFKTAETVSINTS